MENQDKTESQEAKNQEVQERIERLAAAGLWDPLTVLKMRLDLVTQLLVPDSLLPTLEVGWSTLMEGLIEELESHLAQQTLLEGVRPRP